MNDTNFTTIINKSMSDSRDEKLKNIIVKSAKHDKTQLDIGTLIYSTTSGHPNRHFVLRLL